MYKYEKNANVTVGPGLCTMLFITFLVLKLTKVIDWSWWWIAAPLWIPFALVVSLSLFAVLIGIIIGLLKKRS